MAKIKLMDKNDEIVEFDHSIDAREALMSGNFFEVEEIIKEVKRKDEVPYKTKEELKKEKSKTVKVPEAAEEKYEEDEIEKDEE